MTIKKTRISIIRVFNHPRALPNSTHPIYICLSTSGKIIAIVENNNESINAHTLIGLFDMSGSTVINDKMAAHINPNFLNSFFSIFSILDIILLSIRKTTHLATFALSVFT